MRDGKACACIDFDHDGPSVGFRRLLAKSGTLFRPRSARELADAFSSDDIEEISRLEGSLKRIASAMNSGDVALAAIITCQLSPDAMAALGALAMSKASPDDPRHPGFPAGEPDGKGGQFRPKDMSPAASAAREAKARRLAQRRSVRSALKRVLSAKRLLRLFGENAIAALTEEVPVLDVLMTESAIEDDLALLKELKDAIAGTDAAADLAEKGAVDLADLQVSSEDLSFDSFDAFKKVELLKQFGRAGDGLDYHHLAEQGPNTGLMSQTDLHSTGNIVRLPRLIHEEINSYYSTPQFFEEGMQTPRDSLRGKSFEEQKSYGVDTLRSLGVVK